MSATRPRAHPRAATTAGPRRHPLHRIAPALLLAAALAPCASGTLAAAPAAPSLDPAEAVFIDSMEEYVVLAGEARFLAPLADAQVTASAGGARPVTATADALGRFEVRYELLDATSIVELRARGVDAQAHEEYASYVGDRAFLLDRAGPDRRLEPADLAALRLNPFSTGLYVAMRDLPQRSLAVDASAFERRARSFSTLDFLNRAPLIAQMAAGDLPLPAGAATTLEAVSSEALALQAMSASRLDTRPCPDNPACAARTRVTNDPDQLRITAPPVDMQIAAYLSPGLGTSVGHVAIELMQDGTGRFIPSPYGVDPQAQRSIVWTLQGDEVRITASNGQPLWQSVSYTPHPSCGCQVQEVWATIALRALFAEGPGGTVLLGTTTETERRYPENPEIPTVPATLIRPSAVLPTILDGIGLPGGFGPLAGQTWMLPRCRNPDCSRPVETYAFAPGPVANEPHRFNANGTGLTLRANEPFTWQVDADERLHLQYASGAGSVLALAGAATPVTGTVSGLFSTPGGLTFDLTEDGAYRRSDTTGFTPATLPGAYRSMIGSAHPYGALSDLANGFGLFGFVFQPGGTGQDLGFNRPLEWSIDAEGRLVFVRANVSANPSPLYPQRRHWELVGSADGSLYFLENIQTPQSGGGTLSPTPDFGPSDRLLRYDLHPDP